MACVKTRFKFGVLLGCLLSIGNTAGATENVPTFADPLVRDPLIGQLIVKLKSTAEADSDEIAGPFAERLSQREDPTAALQRVIARVTQARAPRARVPRSATMSSPQSVSVKREMSGGAHVLQLQAPLEREGAEALAAQFQADPEIEYAEPDYVMFPTMEPTDPGYRNQWAYSDTSAGADLINAWDITTGSPDIVVAVLDTGVRMHSDLAANMLPGYDFISDLFTANDGDGRDPDATDPGDWTTEQESMQCMRRPPYYASNSSWHGTHVAGTIGAVAGNGIGGVGTSWSSKILPLRVLGKCGGSTSDIVDAMRWAAGLPVAGVPDNRYPARVLNMSLGGGGFCGRAYQYAVNAVTRKGAIVVAAAGNSNHYDVGQPANCSGVITVGATDSSGRRASFSNFGRRVDISAPGVEIFSTLNDGKTEPGRDSFAYYSGTSMATPHVAGVVALMLSVNPSLTQKQVKSLLQAGSRPFPKGSDCLRRGCGSGILNAAKSVWAASQR